MEVHKPKPWHGWREFLKEYLIVVVGVLTALGAEQAVEWLHWRHEIADAEQALGVEVASNLRAVRSIEGENACIKARLDTLQAWANGQATRPPGPVLAPVFFFLSNATWEVTNSGQALAHFPLDLRDTYARVYGRFGNESGAIADERQAWERVVALANQSRFESEDLRRLREAIGLARVADARRRGNFQRLQDSARPLARGDANTTIPTAKGDLFAYCSDPAGGS